MLFRSDGIGGSPQKSTAQEVSKIVRDDLKSSGFLESTEKCQWEPKKIIIWLGHVLNFENNTISIITERIESLLQHIRDVLYFGNLARVPVKTIAAIAGKICSMFQVFGDLTKLRTRFLHSVIQTRRSWKSSVKLSSGAISELIFWLNNVNCSNRAQWSSRHTQEINIQVYVYGDASQVAYGGRVVNKGVEPVLIHDNWSLSEGALSSTWRELKAKALMLLSTVPQLEHKAVQWHTDNQSVPLILSRGSMKLHLHNIALRIWDICRKHVINLVTVWMQIGRAHV